GAAQPMSPARRSGVMGLPNFPNPKSEPARGDLAKYLGGDKSIEPPFLVGTTCAVCHATLNPVSPPADPAEPRSENIVGTLGNIYLQEGRLFTAQFEPDDFLWHYGRQQPPGTSDTSRIASDAIFNPNANELDSDGGGRWDRRREAARRQQKGRVHDPQGRRGFDRHRPRRPAGLRQYRDVPRILVLAARAARRHQAAAAVRHRGGA